MNRLRLFLTLFLLLPVAGSAQGGSVKTLDGVFVNVTVVEVERPKSDTRKVSSSGETHRLVVRDNQGKLRNFWVYTGKSFLPALKEPNKFKGKKVRVRYRVVAMSVGNTPMPSMIEVADSLEVLQL